MVLKRCYICGSTNIVKHHDSTPRWSKKVTSDGKVIRECRMTTWYRCRDCGSKLYEDRAVPERYCRCKRKEVRQK